MFEVEARYRAQTSTSEAFIWPIQVTLELPHVSMSNLYPQSHFADRIHDVLTESRIRTSVGFTSSYPILLSGRYYETTYAAQVICSKIRAQKHHYVV